MPSFLIFCGAVRAQWLRSVISERRPVLPTHAKIMMERWGLCVGLLPTSYLKDLTCCVCLVLLTHNTLINTNICTHTPPHTHVHTHTNLHIHKHKWWQYWMSHTGWHRLTKQGKSFSCFLTSTVKAVLTTRNRWAGCSHCLFNLIPWSLKM